MLQQRDTGIAVVVHVVADLGTQNSLHIVIQMPCL